MAGVLRSDDPNRSNDERRRDELAWAAVQGNIRNAAWRRIDRAVADAVPTARERGLLVSPWQVFLWGEAGAYVTIQPSGEWEFGSVDAKTGWWISWPARLSRIAATYTWRTHTT